MSLSTIYDATAVTYNGTAVTYYGWRVNEVADVSWRAGVVLSNTVGFLLTGGTEPFSAGVLGTFIEDNVLEAPRPSFSFDDVGLPAVPARVVFARKDGEDLSVLSGITNQIDALPIGSLELTYQLTVNYADGAQDTFNIDGPTYRVTRVALSPGRIEVEGETIQSGNLDALYPRAALDAATFPRTPVEHVGRVIPQVVGYARGVQAACLLEDNIHSRYLFAVCSIREFREFVVDSILSPNRIVVQGDPAAGIGALRVGDTILVEWDPATFDNNAGRVVVTGINRGSPARGKTELTVAVAVTSEGGVFGTQYLTPPGAKVVVPPQVRAVYRNGELVPSSEYRVEVVRNAPSSSVVQYLTQNLASINFTAGSATLAQDGVTARFTSTVLDSSNYALMRYWPSSGGFPTVSPPWQPGSTYMLEVDTRAGNGTAPIVLSIMAGAVFTTVGTVEGWCSVPIGAAQRTFCYTRDWSGEERWTFANWTSASAGTYTPGVIELTAIRAVTNMPAAPYLAIAFAAEQRDFVGALYDIRCDVEGNQRNSPADELSRILAEVALVDGPAFDRLGTILYNRGVRVDYAYNKQAAVRGYVEQLARLAQCTLKLTPGGVLTPVYRDLSAIPLQTFDDRLGDRIEVVKYWNEPVTEYLTVRYYPSVVAADVLERQLEQHVMPAWVDIVGTETVLEFPMIANDAVATAVLEYETNCLAFAQRLQVKVYGRVFEVGDAFTVKSALFEETGIIVLLVESATLTDYGCDVVGRKIGGAA